MEIIKIYNLKTAKQTIELENQGKIKLNIYKSLKNAFSQNSKKIFDLLIITYYKSIDFNREIHENTVLIQMIDIKSKYLNFILTNFKININKIKMIIHKCSYKSFKILLKSPINSIESIFINLCTNNSLRFIKLFISTLFNRYDFNKNNLIDLILKRNWFSYSILDFACGNKLNVVKFLIKFIELKDPKLIDFNINMICNSTTAKNEDIIKYLLENFKFNLNEKNVAGVALLHYTNNLNVVKLLIKHDGNFHLEINENGYLYYSKYEILKFLTKYIKPTNNEIIENSEIHKFIYFKKK